MSTDMYRTEKSSDHSIPSHLQYGYVLSYHDDPLLDYNLVLILFSINNEALVTTLSKIQSV